MTQCWNVLIFTCVSTWKLIPHDNISSDWTIEKVIPHGNWFHMVKCLLIGQQKKMIPHGFDSTGQQLIWLDTWVWCQKTFRNGFYKHGRKSLLQALVGERGQIPHVCASTEHFSPTLQWLVFLLFCTNQNTWFFFLKTKDKMLCDAEPKMSSTKKAKIPFLSPLSTMQNLQYKNAQLKKNRVLSNLTAYFALWRQF